MSKHLLHAKPEERIDVGSGFALLRFDDAVGSAAWGFQHECKFWHDDSEPDGVFIKVVAPRLSDHTVTRYENGMVTVRASILCRDCGVHGFVTDSEWTGA